MSNLVKALGIAAVGALTAGAVYLSLKSSDASSSKSDNGGANKKKSGKKNKRSSVGSTTPTLSLSRTNSASPDLSSPTSSSSTNSLAKQGALAFQQKRYGEALQLYNAAILADPTNHKLYINRANVHMFLKDPDSALKDALKSATISPLNNANAHYTAGRALHRLDRFDEALIALKEARTSGGLPAGIDLLDRIKKLEQECVEAIRKKKAEKLKREKEQREKEAKELEARERAAAKEREREKELMEKEMEKLSQSATLGESAVLVNSAMLSGYADEKAEETKDSTPVVDAPLPNKNNNPDKVDDEEEIEKIEKTEEKVEEVKEEAVEMVIANEAATPAELDDPRSQYSVEEERSIAEISTAIVDDAIKFALENTQ